MQIINTLTNLLKTNKQGEKKNFKKYFLSFFLLIALQVSIYIISGLLIKDSLHLTKYICQKNDSKNNGFWIQILNLGFDGKQGLSDQVCEKLKWTVIFYSLFFPCVYVLAPFLIYKYLDKKTERQLLISLFILVIVSLGFFIIFPVEVITEFQFKNLEPETNIIDWMITSIYKADNNSRFNSLPSLHVGLSWLCYVGFRKKQTKPIPKTLVYSKLFFCIMVFISTFAIKQHYIMDGIVAILLVEIIFFCVGKWMDKSRQLYLKPSIAIKKTL
ncbi:MAG: hypothetical protein AB3F67_0760 [Candidatus Phytoplasma solani]